MKIDIFNVVPYFKNKGSSYLYEFIYVPSTHAHTQVLHIV